MPRLFLISLMGLGFLITVRAQGGSSTQQPSIIIGPSVHISADRPTAPHVESFLAISPKDPNRMLASSISYENGKSTSVVYVSRDGGRSWVRPASFGAGVPHFSGSDPAVYYDSTGAALFTSINNPSDRFSRVWRSADGGLNWDSVTIVPGGSTYDREYLGIDRTSGPYAGRIYFAGTVTIKRPIRYFGVAVPSAGNLSRPSYPALGLTFSTDNGLTFLPASVLDPRFSDRESAGTGGAGDLLITSRGTLVVPFIASVDLKPMPPRAFWVFVSENGGGTFSARQGLPFDWGPRGPRQIITSSNIRAAIDQSKGPFADRIYITYIDFANDRYDIKVTHSDDLGASWSGPVKVNDNSGPNDPSNIAIAVNGEGVVSLIWNDRRDDPTGQCYRVYASASFDGGDSFLPNTQFSTHTTCPNTPGNWSGSATLFSLHNQIILNSVPTRFSNGGETQGLVAGPDGRFHATWNNDVSGVMQLWYTSFTVQKGGQVVGVRRVNRTQDMSFESSTPVIDFASKSVSFTVSVKNNSFSYIAAPLTLVIDRIESDFGGLIVTNADNSVKGEGAAWKLLANRKGLAPGEQSEKVLIWWQFDGQVPELKTPLNQFTVHFKVFSEPSNRQQK